MNENEIESYVLGYRKFRASKIFHPTWLIWQLIPSHCTPIRKWALYSILGLLPCPCQHVVFLLYGWIRKRARWSESCVLIGYPSRQDGPILPARDFPCWSCKKMFSFGHIINPLLSKCEFKVAGYCPRSFLRFYWPRLCLGHKNSEKNLVNIQPLWPNKLGQ